MITTGDAAVLGTTDATTELCVVLEINSSANP